METFGLQTICAGNSPVTGEFRARRPVMWSFDAFFDLGLKNGWINNCEADHSRCHYAHYNVTVMDWNLIELTTLNIVHLESTILMIFYL